VRKPLIITLATIVLVVLSSAAALFTLAAFAGEQHGVCARPSPAQLRLATDPAYSAQLTKLARCGR
jgi:hypothetical protein